MAAARFAEKKIQKAVVAWSCGGGSCGPDPLDDAMEEKEKGAAAHGCMGFLSATATPWKMCRLGRPQTPASDISFHPAA